MMERLGKTPEFRDGQRVTDAETLDIARMARVSDEREGGCEFDGSGAALMIITSLKPSRTGCAFNSCVGIFLP